MVDAPTDEAEREVFFFTNETQYDEDETRKELQERVVQMEN